MGRVQAQDKQPSSVLVVRVAGDDSIVLRLRAELNSYRFRVVELPAAKRTERLTQLAEERDAQAALRAKPDAMAVEIWVRGSVGARTNEELVSAGPGRDPAVLAVRVTEAMRARGLVLPPLAAAGGAIAAADSGKRGSATADDAAATPKPSAAAPSDVDDVEPARPTVLPPAALRPATPGSEPKRPEADKERKTEPERKPETEHKPEPERKAEKERTTEPERKAEKERTTEPERKPEPRKPELERKPEPRKAEPKRQPELRKPEPELEPEEERNAELENAAPPEPETPSAPTRSRNALLYAEVGPTGVWNPGTNRLGPALDVFVSVKFRPYQTSSISLVGLIPLLSTDIKGNGGNSVEVQTFGIGGFGDLHLPLGRVELNVGIGGMAMLSSMLVDSSPDGPAYESDLPMESLAALLGRVGASLALTPDLRVAASLMVGLTVNDLQVQLTSPPDVPMTPIVRWGRPLLFGTLSLELALPWDR